MSTSTRIGISLGDPAGIGPELVADALLESSAPVCERLVIFGDEPVLARALAARGARVSEVTAELVDAQTPGAADIEPGRPDDRAGAAQVAYLEAAANAARRGEIAALVTAPIAKATARRAGFAFPGHTEFLAERLEAAEVAMLFAGPTLRVVLATVHLGLAEALRTLSADAIRRVARLAATALVRDFGVARPRIGVLGVNPHAGEGGLFGTEEREVIAPAIEDLRAELAGRAEIVGPLVPDAAFRSRCDLFVAMYHDQGLIPVKLVDFERAVNVTLGLPIVRTSPDHGVAYDIAGRGVARPESFRAALALALEMLERRCQAPAQGV